MGGQPQNSIPPPPCLRPNFCRIIFYLNTCPASFPIISIVKLARKRMLLEFSTLVERYWMVSTETFGTYSQDAAGKLKLTFKLVSLHYF